ncbi:type III effector [Tenacibaculum sp. SZ-18]|uniref:HopJ type III effector protein n=1 Tax=Tenacibaculum sp. SZ-18 TaxID=754423 RepID=UPI000C2D407A|nr:HopJ type III effector protein [Tenacibaculum sp. SZ-18]AUC16766.1 type III effector [Tenacibaculum sp. SZ-18]
MTISEFKNKLQNEVATIDFKETIELIEGNYNFTPSAFKNGELENQSTENQGSCKVFSFAIQEGLSKEETLACFGQYYIEVVNDPKGIGHQNIRNFMKTGFEGLSFENEVLTEL